MSMQTLTMDQVFDCLTRQTQWYDKPVWFWGASGIGKSAVTKAWSKYIAETKGLTFWEVKFDPNTGGVTHLPDDANPEEYWGFIDLRAVLLDILDVKGAPYLDREAEMTRFLKASLLPDIKRHGFQGTLFLDELAQAVPMVTNGLSQLIYDRRIGDSYVFPDQWVIIAAGNRKQDNAATSKAGAHIYNRFAHYELVADALQFSAWLRDNGFNTKIAQFCRFKRDLVHSYNKGDVVFPTPRAFETVSKIVDMAEQTGLTLNEMEKDIAANIGLGPAREVTAFLQVYDNIVSYQEIVDDPKNAQVPILGQEGSLAATYAIFGMLVLEVTEPDIDKVMTYVRRFDQEYQTFFIMDLKALKEDLVETVAIAKWRADHPLVAV